MFSQKNFDSYRRAILGAAFDVGYTWVTPAVMRKFNKKYRKIDKPTDILSFPLSASSGEILLCKSEVATHAKEFGVSATAYLPYLVIHGLIHLKGVDHGRTMDRLEILYCNKFGVTRPQSITHNGTTHRSGHRRRHVPSTRRDRSRG